MGAYSDTICALVTPPGVGGLAVVRLSGPDALVIADRCFRGKQPLQEVPTHTIHYGRFLRGEELVDMVTASVFRAPRSYTGEDTVEFGCHGSMVVADEIVAALIEAGARLAEPGEFTRRAFLNGKLDLTQVEAVADLIYATSVPGARLAARQLVGGLTQRLRHLREQLLQAAALLELELDFAEEDLEFVPREVLLHQLSQGEAMCRRLAESYRAAQVLRSGFFVGLVGYPNAGKSSLFNALLQRQRAIVSPLPGTTRDYLEESLYLDGIPVRLIDTAGVREAADTIELQGIALAQEAIRQCNVLLLINDATCGVGAFAAITGGAAAALPADADRVRAEQGGPLAGGAFALCSAQRCGPHLLGLCPSRGWIGGASLLAQRASSAECGDRSGRAHQRAPGACTHAVGGGDRCSSAGTAAEPAWGVRGCGTPAGGGNSERADRRYLARRRAQCYF
jgi:tRNA modification GTPase